MTGGLDVTVVLYSHPLLCVKDSSIQNKNEKQSLELSGFAYRIVFQSYPDEVFTVFWVGSSSRGFGV